MMEIMESVKKGAGYLSAKNLEFYDYVNANPEFFDRQYFCDMDLQQEKRRLQPWPTFIDKENLDHLEKINLQLFNLIAELPYRLFGSSPEKIAKQFNLPPKFVEIYFEGYEKVNSKNFIGRGDYVLSDNNFNLIEFNTTTLVGGLELPLWEDRCQNNSLIKKFLESHKINLVHHHYTHRLMEHLLDSSQIDLHSGSIHVALFEYVTEDKAFFGFLEKAFSDIINEKSINAKLSFCAPKDIEFEDDDVLFNNEKIDLMLEFKSGMISRKLLNAVKNDKLRILNGPGSGLLTDKNNVALLSEYAESSVFSEEEREIIQKHVTWTRKLRPQVTHFQHQAIDLIPFVLENKDLFILKPAAGHAGIGIVAGKETEQEVWQQKINKAYKNNNSIIQELIEPQKLYYLSKNSGGQPMNIVFGALTFGPNFGGCLLRVKPEEEGIVINSRQNAEVAVVLECC